MQPDRDELMLIWLHQQQEINQWYREGDQGGVVIRNQDHVYLRTSKGDAVEQLVEGARDTNIKAALTVESEILSLIIRRHHDFEKGLGVEDGLHLQVLKGFAELAQCSVHQSAAVIHEPPLLVIWDDDPWRILQRAEGIMRKIVHAGLTNPNTNEDYLANESADVHGIRKTVLIQPLQTACTLLITVGAMGTGWRRMAMEIAVDHSYRRLWLIAIMPLQFWLGLFFMQSIVGCIFQMLGPTNQLNQNSKFYSAQVSPSRVYRSGRLPHVTIQCPVYKESLVNVIQPTISSLKEAISTYEMQGGTANIFMNDDGLQLLDDDEAQKRRSSYAAEKVGWVARPKHNADPGEGEAPFFRAGKFKKASNMNYALGISNRIESKLAQVQKPSTRNVSHEMASYKSALEEVKEEDRGRTWAEGDIRIGDYILLIDSDTRVPPDCLRNAINEMELSPEVAIIQFPSGVMNITSSFFEKGITFFTELIYTAICNAVANGDIAPFVGHNAVLRWSALQDIAHDEDLNVEKYWSESTVSEDFDMALRLQSKDYIIRLGAYAGDGFKEGVSLTVYDELARWEKYAYGCNELIFHPMRYWLVKGPFTPLFWRFLGSNIPLPSKVTIVTYIGTYYAIASAWLLTVLNYFLVGWFNGHLDHYYLDSFKIYFSIIVVFNALGNLALATLRYRTKQSGFLSAIATNLKWTLLLSLFLGGISLHLSQALVCHMLSIDMSWGATAKEFQNRAFFTEVTIIMKKFKLSLTWCFTCALGMGVLASPATPITWQIKSFTAIWPLATVVFGHFFLPIALNPGLMLFRF